MSSITIVSNIISVLTNDPYKVMDDVSSDTLASKERIIARARLALFDATIDWNDLHHQFTMLTRLIDFERQMAVTSERLRGYEFLTGAGDWAGDIVRIAKGVEATVGIKHARQVRERLKSTGLSQKAARAKVHEHDGWRVLKKHHPVSDAWAMLRGELDRIRSWRLAGRQAEYEPRTPGLDRIQYLAAKLGMSRQTLLDAIHVYSERNTAAHHAPPAIENHIKGGKTIDWTSIQKECDAKKTNLDAQLAAGEITRKQRDLAQSFVDEWLRLHKSDGEKALKNAVDMLEKKNTDMAPQPLLSFYDDGKWDDLDI